MRRSKAASLAATTVLAAGSLFLFPRDASPQMVGPRMATRSQLESMLDSLQQVSTVNMSEEGRQQLQLEVSGLALRLQNGDISPGDQIQLTVSGSEKWTGQFAVDGERNLELPDIDAIDLSGVLHTEVEEAITRALARYIREPRIRVEVLKRIGVVGSVGSPGFYAVSGSILVSDAIMIAGGPAPSADLDKIAFRRRGDRILADQPSPVWESLTLDHLGLMSGDEVFVPEKRNLNFWVVFTSILGVAATITFLFTRW
jgi:protein involved in polysaccharide export with SLBB domain